MSVPTAELSAIPPGADSGNDRVAWRRWLGGGRLLIVLAGVALVVALLSLTVPSTPSYDPWSWLVWGYEIVHGSLHTAGGPSWKPLPMLFTTVFAPFGHLQPDMWLVVARAGATMAVLLCFKLAWRLTRDLGRTSSESTGAVRVVRQIAPILAGVLAAGSVINSAGFVSDNALGYSEGFATALMLCSVDRFLDGSRRQAFVLGFFVALDRPEIWPFWGLYGLWLGWKDPAARRLVGGLFVLTLALWFGPAGFSGVTRAQHVRTNSAALRSCPFCVVVKDEAWPTVLNRLKIPGIIALLLAALTLWRARADGWWRETFAPGTRGRVWLLVIGLFGFLWWGLIGLETQLGFSGNARYLVLGTAPVGIACAVAWGWFAQAVARQLGRLGARVKQFASPRVALPAGSVVAAALFLAVPPWIGNNLIDLSATHRALVYQARLRESANEAIKYLGGAKQVLACGTVMTEGFQVPMIAWDLKVRTLQIEDQPVVNQQGWESRPVGKTLVPVGAGGAPNVILQDRDNGSPYTALLPLPATIQHWESLGVRYEPADGQQVGVFRVFTACRK